MLGKVLIMVELFLLLWLVFDVFMNIWCVVVDSGSGNLLWCVVLSMRLRFFMKMLMVDSGV